MEASEAATDTRGWILAGVSGIACIAGASIIFVDVLVRCFPGQKRFRIEESNAFLACSLSLSFGVMIFSALYNMLPASKRYFTKAEYKDDVAGFLMITCFVGGFIGIQVLSRLLHQLMPSHVVDCDHSHDHDQILDSEHGGHSGHGHLIRRLTSFSRRQSSRGRTPTAQPTTAKSDGHYAQNGAATESTPLLPTERGASAMLEVPSRQISLREGVPRAATPQLHCGHSNHGNDGRVPGDKGDDRPLVPPRRKSIQVVRSRVMSFVKNTKPDCDDTGNCFGFTDPCGQECFKHMSSRSALSRHSSIARTSMATVGTAAGITLFPPMSPFPGVVEDDEEGDHQGACSPGHRLSRISSREPLAAPAASETGGDGHQIRPHNDAHSHHHDHGHDHDHDGYLDSTGLASADDVEAQHHHHVPANAFLSIGLQTVIAIALHKFPEGFITYATNVASPALGFNIFMALFVHNIAEGFSMALPLYMALGSRFKAVAWSSLLGGLSQPAGAAVAWAWFHFAKRSHYSIDTVAYAAIFAVTAGIMTSVALQLFVESLGLNHSRNLSIGFAFVGMILLGVSSSLVEDD